MTAAQTIARYCIEDLTAGQSASYARTITERDVDLFGEVSGDMNPLHFDEEYAKKTIFRGRIAHGMLSASFISTVFGTKFPGAGSIFMSAVVRFKAPVRIGDTVTTTVTVREIDLAKRRVVFDVACKVGELTVIDGEAMLKVPSRAKDA
jgi:3-hydroxybutyryl-CoA dehydratase